MKEFLIHFPIKESGEIASAMIKPDASDWWGAVTRNGVCFDIHYCEDYNQIAVYRLGPDSWREKLVHAQAIDPTKPYDPMVKPEDVYAQLQDAWLNAEGQVSLCRDEVKRANDQLARGYAKASEAYDLFTKFKKAQHDNKN